MCKNHAYFFVFCPFYIIFALDFLIKNKIFRIR